MKLAQSFIVRVGAALCAVAVTALFVGGLLVDSDSVPTFDGMFAHITVRPSSG